MNKSINILDKDYLLKSRKMILKKYRLGDIAEILVSSIDKKTREGESSVKLCNFVDVYHNWAISTGMVQGFMDATTNEKNIEKFSLRKGYVAFTKDSETRGDIGIPTYIADDLENTVLGYHCALVKPNEKILSGKYLNAFLHSNYIKKYFELNATGSGMRYTLSTDTLSNIPVFVPSLEMQEYIGNIFSDIDRKICLNRSINHNLEAMAKQLYDYWFVQFDFPNEEDKPYKSSGGEMIWSEKLKRKIPEGWDVVSLLEVCDVNKKTISKTDFCEQIEYLDTGNITEGRINETELYMRTDAPSRAQRKVEDLTILYSSVRPRLKHYGILDRPNANYIVSTGFVTLDAKDKTMSMMIYLFLTSDSMTDYLGSIADTAVSSYPSINPSDLATLDIVLPKANVLHKFNSIIVPMYRASFVKAKECNMLTKQRDELLPLLMNGQVSVVNYDLSNC